MTVKKLKKLMQQARTVRIVLDTENRGFITVTTSKGSFKFKVKCDERGNIKYARQVKD